MAHSRAVSVLYLLESQLILELLVFSACWCQCMGHSRAVSVFYLLESVHGSFQSCKCPLPAGASRMAHFRAVSVSTCWSQEDGSFYVSSTCWSQCMAHSRAVSIIYLLESVHGSF